MTWLLGVIGLRGGVTRVAYTTDAGSGSSRRGAARRRRRQEPIATPRHGGDEARLAPVVLEARAQVADLTVHDVALGDVVHAPERVEDLFTGDDAPGVGS